ncbi:MAG: arginine deiminase-related protein [Bacteroidia bacterium]|nr:arginine deiminase-related protein [Bacteroidia bacterium]
MLAAQRILMMRPASFGFNHQTASTNAFQQLHLSEPEPLISEKAVQEFDCLLKRMRDHNILVDAFDDTALPPKPDAVFPNNWISMHPDGTVVIYPMMAENRRAECREDIVAFLQKHYVVNRIIDLRFFERQNIFLEGTGSITFCHEKKKAFAALSPRTHRKALEYLCREIGYEPLFFYAVGPSGQAVYHTNVVLNFCGNVAVWCADAVPDAKEKREIEKKLSEVGFETLKISFEQMNSFCGNVLCVRNQQGKEVLLMSSTAGKMWHENQKDFLNSKFELLEASIPTIESYGGGSVRCMMAENFLEKKIYKRN